MIHALKTLPEYFEAVISGRKTFEIRLNDRGYHVGDYLALNEWYGDRYTGRSCMVQVDYILANIDFLQPGYVAMSIKPCAVASRTDKNLYRNDCDAYEAYAVPLIKMIEETQNE